MKKRIVINICGIVLVSAIVVLVWWFFPYFHSVSGTDEETGFNYCIAKDTTVLTKYVGEETVVYVPERLKGRKVKVGWQCFEGTNIQEVYVPDTVEVSRQAFVQCKSLKKFMGSSNKVISNNMFFDNNNLEEVIFKNKIEKIEIGAFAYCSSLKEVDFLDEVRYLGSSAFRETGIEQLPELEKLEHAGNLVFYETPWEKNQEGDFIIIGNSLQLYSGSEKIVHIPEGVTEVCSAFEYSEKNKSSIQVNEIYIPNTVKSLNYLAFANQENVIVYVPDSVTEVVDGDKNKEVKLEGNVKIITTSGSYAEDYAQKYDIEYEIIDGWDLTESETVSLNKKDKPILESYAVEGDAFSPFMYDIDEDGKEDKIEILCEVSNNYVIDSLMLQVGDLKKSIEINTEDTSEDLIYDNLKCYILHVGRERNLIYIHTSYALDNLYFGVVCEVTESEINVLNDKAGIRIDDQSLVDLQNVVCRNESFLLGRIGYFYILSYWQFDEAGQISKKEGTEYFLSEGFKVETIAELTVDEVGENGAVIESQVVLPVGTILVPLCTDDETYVDFIGEEGKIYRVSFEVGMDDGGRTGFIQGTAVSEWMEVVV